MRQELKRLGSDTAMYGISTILGRMLNFLLLPLYTNVLPPGEYGIASYVFSIIAFVTVLYSYGMESAYFKYSSSGEVGTPKENFSTPLTALAVTSLLFSVVLFALSGPLVGALNIPDRLSAVVFYSVGVLALDAVAIIPFAALRMERRPGVFAAIKLVNIVSTIGLNILFVVVLRRGVNGIFLSNLIASGLTLVLLLPVIKRNFEFRLNRGLLVALLKFGLPFVPAGLATMAVQVIDRPILRAMTDDATVGIYQANYRLGIFMMLVVQMFDFAWRPFYFSTAKDPNARQIFARVLTYLMLFMSAMFLAVSLFIGDIVHITIFGRHIIHPDYWGGLGIVPVVMAGYMCLGISNNMSAGIYIEKRTSLMPPITFTGAIVNVVANLLLIPSSGMVGAAWATFLAYFAMAAMLYVIVRKIYPVPYEFGRLARIVGATAVVFFAGTLIPMGGMSALLRLSAKAGLLVAFGGLMFTMRFFEPRELAAIRELFKRRVSDGRSPDAGPDIEGPAGK